MKTEKQTQFFSRYDAGENTYDQDDEIPLEEIKDEDIGCLVMPSLLLPDTLKSFTFHEKHGFDKYGDFMIELADLKNHLDLIVQAA